MGLSVDGRLSDCVLLVGSDKQGGLLCTCIADLTLVNYNNEQQRGLYHLLSAK
jgi:hypothetical protein